MKSRKGWCCAEAREIPLKPYEWCQAVCTTHLILRFSFPKLMKDIQNTCINLLQPLQNMLIPSSDELFCPGYIWGSWKIPLLLFSTTTHALPLRSRIKPLKWVAKQINWHWSLKQWNSIAIKPNTLKLGRYKTWSKYRLYVQFFSLLLKSEENKNKREGENAFR